MPEDNPAYLFHLQLIANDIADWKAKSEVVAVFHTNAEHVTLHDSAYNSERNIATGNPYSPSFPEILMLLQHFRGRHVVMTRLVPLPEPSNLIAVIS